jgi:hypothetical protein
VKEAALLHADVDERRLHSGKDRGDESLVDVADVTLFLLAIDEELAELLVFEDGDAGFFGGDVDEDLAFHESLGVKLYMVRSPMASVAGAGAPDASPHPSIERDPFFPGGAEWASAPSKRGMRERRRLGSASVSGSRTDGPGRKTERASLDGSR